MVNAMFRFVTGQIVTAIDATCGRPRRSSMMATTLEHAAAHGHLAAASVVGRGIRPGHEALPDARRRNQAEPQGGYQREDTEPTRPLRPKWSASGNTSPESCRSTDADKAPRLGRSGPV